MIGPTTTQDMILILSTIVTSNFLSIRYTHTQWCCMTPLDTHTHNTYTYIYIIQRSLKTNYKQEIISNLDIFNSSR